MAYTAETLITRSWYLSGIVARNLQVVTGDQIQDGLMLLNALLDFKQIETDLIPYYTYIQVNPVAGQEYYYLPFVSAIESLTFNIDVVRYPMDVVSRRNYYGSARVDNIASLPFSWNFNRGEGGGTLALYFLPEAVYPLKMMVKIFLNDVSLNTDLTNVLSSLSAGYVSNITVTAPGSGYTGAPIVSFTGGNGTGATAEATIVNGMLNNINVINPGTGYSSPPTVVLTGGGGTGAAATAAINNYIFLQSNNAGFDTSYIEYLRYALAEMMCSEYGLLFNPESAKILKKYERKLMYMSPPDLSMAKVTILASNNQVGFNYGDVNIGHGWRSS